MKFVNIFFLSFFIHHIYHFVFNSCRRNDNLVANRLIKRTNGFCILFYSFRISISISISFFFPNIFEIVTFFPHQKVHFFLKFFLISIILNITYFQLLLLLMSNTSKLLYFIITIFAA